MQSDQRLSARIESAISPLSTARMFLIIRQNAVQEDKHINDLKGTFRLDRKHIALCSYRREELHLSN